MITINNILKSFISDMNQNIGIAVIVGIVGLVGWIVKVARPPPPKKFVVESKRVKLRDGRYLAYKEAGVPKEKARFKIVVIHGFNIAKDIFVNVSQEFIEELQIYILCFDRSGYGESDPNPNRFVESEALDLEELADHLELGSKFYIMGISMGGYPAWSCLKYIPNRLAGIALVAPHFNYYWPGFPKKLIGDGFKKLPSADQWTLRIGYYAPWLFTLWMKQKFFPVFNVVNETMDIFSPNDLEIIKMLADVPNINEHKIKQQGFHYCLYQDLMAGHGKWGFSPMVMKNPYPNNDVPIHMWQGGEDKIIPSELNRYIGTNVDWIKYHELPKAGHMFFFDRNNMETILRKLFLG